MDANLKKVGSSYFLRAKLFPLLSERKKLLVANYSQWLQKKLKVGLSDYKNFGH